MSLKPGYATPAEADIELADDSVWIAYSNEEKEEALSWARVYIDDTYMFASVVDEDSNTYPEVITANSILAAEHKLKSLFHRQSPTGPLEESEVRAGSVLSRKRYRSKGMPTWVDPFPEITALLTSIGFIIVRSSSLTTVHLQRA
jgi:hypothetical protein